MNVVILGPAGSGKSTMTRMFSEYLLEEGYRVSIVNLDPGCAMLPYRCDYDVRRRFTITEIMRKERLGPNGALLRAMDKLCLARIPSFDADFTLIDTPGQLEVFAFHKAGPKLMERIGRPIGVFLLDATIGLRDLPAVYLYALATRYRLGIDMITVVNKTDLISKREAERIKAYLLSPASQAERLKPPGMLAELYVPLSEFLQKVVPAQRIPLISAPNKMGFSELLDMIHETKCACGDLT